MLLPVVKIQSVFVQWNLGLHDRNFRARINNENFLRGATERNTYKRQEVIFARGFEAARAG